MPKKVTKIFLIFGQGDLEHRLCQLLSSGYLHKSRIFHNIVGIVVFICLEKFCVLLVAFLDVFLFTFLFRFS